MRLSFFFFTVAFAVETTTAFCVLPLKATVKATHLKYNIIYPDDAESEDQKKPAANPAQQAPAAQQKSADGAVASFEGYQDYDELKEVTEVLNVDAYDNMAGGIIPGQQLSSLCSDD